MTFSTSEIEELSLPLPITQAERQVAQQFSQQQSTPQKAEQVQLNTLAVCVVHSYLQMMGIASDRTASDSWNPVMHLCTDVADLEVSGVGRLECRPIKQGESTCYIPPEVWEERMGYIVVEIEESQREGKILGFTPTVAVEALPIAQLQPPEDVLDLLMEPANVSDTTVNLRQWFHDVFEAGWQTVESLLAPEQLTPAFRFRTPEQTSESEPEQSEAGVRRGKLIDLGMQLSGRPVALIVEITPAANQKTNVLLQLHPTGSQTYLPPNLKLVVLDESGAVFLETQARSTDETRTRSGDSLIQLEFRGSSEERFSVQVALGNAEVTETFVI